MKNIPKPLVDYNLGNTVQEFYSDFISKENDEIFEIIIAANYLGILPLIDLGCAKIATLIKNKTVDEIRKLFKIENDFTPEEEEQIKSENKWSDEL